jgi:hypothetical protein
LFFTHSYNKQYVYILHWNVVNTGFILVCRKPILTSNNATYEAAMTDMNRRNVIAEGT